MVARRDNEEHEGDAGVQRLNSNICLFVANVIKSPDTVDRSIVDSGFEQSGVACLVPSSLL